MNPRKIKSICILRLSALGDCINTFGLIHALLAEKPDLKILWVIDHRFAPLFRNHLGEDLVPMLAVDFKQGIFNVRHQIKKALGHEEFDYVFALQTSIKASLCLGPIKAKHKLGYDSERAREGQFLFVDNKVPSPANPHVLAGFMAFSEFVGFDDLRPSWDFELDESELLPYKNEFKEDKIFAISPASAKESKNWTVEGYAAVAEHALDEGFKVVLLGSNKPSELELCQKIAAKIDNRCLNLCGKTNLRQLAAVISLSALVLSPDSAAMHLASALSIPVIGLFAIHNPKRVGAWNYPDLWVSVYNDCASRECRGQNISWRYRVRDPNAMKLIDSEEVIDTFDKACEKYLDC